MENLDKWISDVAQAIKVEADKAVGEEYKKLVVLYAEIFDEAVKREWDDYMSSYTPKMYNRTGMTRAGIIVDTSPKVRFDGTIEASVQFVDAFMNNYDTLNGGKRHVFMAMNDGWGNKSLSDGDSGYRYVGFEGLHILEEVEQELKRQLPSYINLEIKWSGGYG